MARSYYIFKSGRLRRKGNTLYLEKDEEASSSQKGKEHPAEGEDLSGQEQEPFEEPLSEEDASLAVQAGDEEVMGEADSQAQTADGQAEGKSVSSPSSTASSSERPRPIPVEDVEELFLFGEITMNTKLLNFLAQNGIPCHIFNYYGFYSGTYYPRESNVSGHLLVKQVEHYTDPVNRLTIAKEIVRGAYHNLHRNLLYYRNRGKSVQEAVEALEQEAIQVEAADSVAALMGAEGRMRQTYYLAFNEILKMESPFLKRVKRPPDNMINTLISFGNSLLYTAVLSQIYRTPLNPTISYLHEPGARRFSLALDIAELFKPIIVDKMIFKLINKQMVTEDDLMEEVGYAHLKESARKVMVQEFDERLRTTIKHRRMGRNVSYRGFIRLECYKLVRHLLGIEPYQALRAWW